MQKLFRRRRMVFIFSAATLLALTFLPSALPKMDFQPSQPIGGGKSETAIELRAGVEAALASIRATPLWKKAFVGLALVAGIIIVLTLLDPEARKKVIRTFFQSMLYGLVVAYLVKTKAQWFTGLADRLNLSIPEMPEPASTEILPAPVFTPPQEQSWISFAVGLGILLLVALLIWWGYRLRARLTQPGVGLEELATIVHHSLNNLKAGKNYENSILECYERMSEVVARKQGLHRQQATTPSEFSTQLTRAGLPQNSVQTLTVLFEAARYGRKPASQSEIEEATACLTSILKYCKEIG
ncbi:MAG: DUF4129 domain-containing protein [Anaerolineales bacterium]|nr:DUF4129 domain-containing protein [Anaerolineales bacterium]